MARVELPQSRLRARKRRRRIFMGATIFGVIALVVSVAGFLAYAPSITIAAVEVDGTETLNPALIQKEVTEILNGYYVWVVPYKNIFLYPKGEISKRLLEGFPLLKVVESKAKDFTTLQVHVVERHPKALWCSETCYLMDEEGVIYAPAPEFERAPYIAYEGVTTGAGLPKQFLTAEEFRALFALVDALSHIQVEMPVERVVVDSVYDARAYFAGGFYVVFALHEAGGDVFERFSLALQAEPFKTRTLEEFVYLDLRFGDKLYYKLKD